MLSYSLTFRDIWWFDKMKVYENLTAAITNSINKEIEAEKAMIKNMNKIEIIRNHNDTCMTSSHARIWIKWVLMDCEL